MTFLAGFGMFALGFFAGIAFLVLVAMYFASRVKIWG